MKVSDGCLLSYQLNGQLQSFPYMHMLARTHHHTHASRLAPLGVFYLSFPPVLSHLASLIYAVSLFSFGTRINLIPVYEAAIVSQIEVDRPAGELLDGKTDGQRRDRRQKRAGELLNRKMNKQAGNTVRQSDTFVSC